MMVPAKVKVFYPLFSDVAVDAVDYLKSLRDENSVINDVREAVLGKWAVECKYFIKLYYRLHCNYELFAISLTLCFMFHVNVKQTINRDVIWRRSL